MAIMTLRQTQEMLDRFAERATTGAKNDAGAVNETKP
jgi:hypothetical protein